jgi:hypothetical protein
VEEVWFVWVGVLHRGWGLDSFSGEGKTGVGGFPGEDKYGDSGLDETESRMTAWGGAGAETSSEGEQKRSAIAGRNLDS